MKGRPLVWIFGGVLLTALLVGVLTMRAPQFYSYVVFETVDSLQLVFLQRARTTRSECEQVGKRVADAMLANCTFCRLAETWCLETLDTRQRKLLSGQPVDVPVVRMPHGVIAFMSGKPEFAQEACRETERQASRSLPAECAKAGADGIALSLAKVSGTPGPVMPRADALLRVVLLAALVCFIVCWFIIRSGRLHGRYSHDLTATGPQKFHTMPTPRIGGIAIAAALAASVLALEPLDWLSSASAYGLTMLALSAIPAFAGGFGEDVTRKVGVLARLMLTFASAVFASLLVGATLDRLDMPGLDTLLMHWPLFAIAFTAFAVGGIANSINIVDGYNGLAGGYAVIALAALAWVAGQVGDPVVLTASLAMLGALLGFLVWNYPGGKIFMGDGGAYLLGFWLGELAVLLVVRNPDVSPWFPLMLLAYPITDTLFSIYRRFVLRGRSAGEADAMHLHQLIFNRLARIAVGAKDAHDMRRRNNVVAPFIWSGAVIFALLSLLAWRSTPWLLALAVSYWIGYLCLYIRLARWSGPAWMVIPPRTREL